MNHSELVAALTDIALPPAPPVWPTLVAAWLGLALVASAGLVWRRMRHRRATASAVPPDPRAQLRALERAWRAGDRDDRSTAYHLATWLRLCFDLARLGPTAPPTLSVYQAEWTSLIERFDRIRYRPGAAARLGDEDFAVLHRWLGTATVGSQRAPHV